MNPTTESDLAISIKGLSKAYRIWRDPSARLKAPLWDTVGSLVPTFLRPKALKQRLSHGGTSRYYTDFYALDQLDLQIRKGEAVGIIGRNGSGKSTLLQMIAGTLTPTTGEIQVHGRVAALLELGSGFNPEFTGRENVFLNASVLGLSEEQTAQKLDAILEFADIGDFVDQPVKTYSSGMTMRLAFAVIAHVDADILIVDEALAVGDVFFVQKCMRFIRKFKENGTLLIVTHDTGTVQSLCDRAVWLHHGECKQIGTTKEVSEAYLEATYAEQQGVKFFEKRREKKTSVKSKEKKPVKDLRLQYINQSNHRNDIKLFEFNPDTASFGIGGARITGVELLDQDNEENLAYIIGGEEVIIRIHVETKTSLKAPIVGFILKNHLGQDIFSDNTFLTTQDNPFEADESDHIVADFKFQMPTLRTGGYSVAVAIADGTQENHVQHHWIHDAIALKSETSSTCNGLVGIPMREIKLYKKEDK